MLASLTTKELLSLTVLGALVTTVGSLAGLVLKERVFARSFERWRASQALKVVHRKYRDPIVLSALELCNRLEEVCAEYPTSFLRTDILVLPSARPTRSAERDRYYDRYKLESSLYRLCAFLGWLELYRQDLVFLDAGGTTDSKDADTALRHIRADLADGHLNEADDWPDWADALVFREEQRAIGELMIAGTGVQRSVIGFAAFTELLVSPRPDAARWIGVAKNFLLDLELENDFRRIRLRRLLVHLVDMVEAAEPFRLQDHHRQSREAHRAWLSALAT